MMVAAKVARKGGEERRRCAPRGEGGDFMLSAPAEERVSCIWSTLCRRHADCGYGGGAFVEKERAVPRRGGRATVEDEVVRLGAGRRR